MARLDQWCAVCSTGYFKSGKLALMFELSGKQNRELGPVAEQFAQAASDHDAEAGSQIGPIGSFTGEECFGSL